MEDSSDLQPLGADIAAVNGTSPGPKSGITYDIIVRFKFKDVLVSSAVPHNIRPGGPDECDIHAARVGDPVTVHVRGSQIRFTIIESLALASCSGGGGP